MNEERKREVIEALFELYCPKRQPIYYLDNFLRGESKYELRDDQLFWAVTDLKKRGVQITITELESLFPDISTIYGLMYPDRVKSPSSLLS